MFVCLLPVVLVKVFHASSCFHECWLHEQWPIVWSAHFCFFQFFLFLWVKSGTNSGSNYFTPYLCKGFTINFSLTLVLQFFGQMNRKRQEHMWSRLDLQYHAKSKGRWNMEEETDYFTGDEWDSRTNQTDLWQWIRNI